MQDAKPKKRSASPSVPAGRKSGKDRKAADAAGQVAPMEEPNDDEDDDKDNEGEDGEDASGGEDGSGDSSDHDDADVFKGDFRIRKKEPAEGKYGDGDPYSRFPTKIRARMCEFEPEVLDTLPTGLSELP